MTTTVYELSDSEFEALQALGTFADRAFPGYGNNYGGEEEQEMAIRFVWLVEAYAKLIAKVANKKEKSL